jgi:hypothetical protein
MGWTKNPEFEKRVQVIVIDEIRKVSFQLMRSVIFRTPVDTGRLKGAWRVGINSAPTGKPRTLDKTGAPTRKVAISKLKGVNKNTKSIWIVNNLPYAVPIEEGHGAKNIAGVMVASTISLFKTKGIIK